MINKSLPMDACIRGGKEGSKKRHVKIFSVFIDNRYKQSTVIYRNLS